MKTNEDNNQRMKEVINKVANVAKIAHFMNRYSVSEDSKEYFSIHENNLTSTWSLLFKSISASSRELSLLHGNAWEPFFAYVQMRFWKYSDLEMIDMLKRKVSGVQAQLDSIISEYEDEVIMSELKEASSNLDILVSALSIQRFYASAIVSETN